MYFLPLCELLENRLLKLGFGFVYLAHGLRHRQKLFGFGVHGGHVAFGAGGVAAEHDHLLKDDHGRAVVDGRRGGNHAGAARTDDEPPMRAVCLQVPVRRDGRPVPPERPAAPRRW